MRFGIGSTSPNGARQRRPNEISQATNAAPASKAAHTVLDREQRASASERLSKRVTDLHHGCDRPDQDPRLGCQVLNLHRLAPGAEAYYLDQVVSGIEDYYAEAGEAPGYWLASSEQLGLDGLVRPDDLRAVLTGTEPATGESLHRAKNRKVPGWDLAFRAPKSVSILWALGEPGVAREVVAAHESAVAKAVSYLEDQAAFTRTGRNGIHRVKADGFIAAGFRHRTSRDRDPLLHTHVLVANSVRTPDGYDKVKKAVQKSEGQIADAIES